MRYLSYQIIFFLFSLSMFAQSPHGDKFDMDCSECHSADSWKFDFTKISFDHSSTGFALLGQHLNVDCRSCHNSLVFSKMDKDCFSCHKDIHQNTVGMDCSNCHTSSTWIVKDIIGLHQKGRFPLLGAHQTSDCAKCHTGYQELKFEPLNIDCYSCHKQDYESAQNPDHLAANFSTDCQDCHNVNSLSWNTTNVNHSFFPLTGGHALPSCYSCHQPNTFSGLSPECYSCHRQTYEATQNPNHIAAGLPTTCNVCHSINGWVPASFNHNLTSFPLTGAHINTNCQSCHQTGYSGTPSECYACHQTDYNNTTNPNHISVSFPTSCIDCHSTSAWQPATFNHDNQFFPIYSGKHKDKWNQCSDCHTSPNNYSIFSCIDCHEHNRTETDNDHRGVQGYIYNSESCLSCHPQGRKEGAFNHATSGFPLTGLHLSASCAECHQNGYSGTSSVCSDCHLAEYNGAVNPNHQSLSISTECGTCHTPSANWQPALYPQHNQVYQLLGRHLEIANDCESCHNGNYATTQNQCVGCHQNQYNLSNNPNHSAAGIPTECSDCHNSTSWSPSTFNHSNSGFALTGSHQPLQCSSCHNGTITGLTSDCVPCHQTNFNNTTNPNHLAAGFPVTCADCHTTIAWTPASFDHDNQYFPIYSGKHKEKWNQCSDCHRVPSNYSLFSCIDCHEHRKSEMDSKHHEVNNYVYNSVNCYDCHPNGNDAPMIFNHSMTAFPLTGAHTHLECAQCHSSSHQVISTECYGCHINDYLNTLNPNHQTKGISTDCNSCHTTNNWSTGIKILEESREFY